MDLMNYLEKKLFANNDELFFLIKDVILSILKDDDYLFDENFLSNK